MSRDLFAIYLLPGLFQLEYRSANGQKSLT